MIYSDMTLLSLIKSRVGYSIFTLLHIVFVLEIFTDLLNLQNILKSVSLTVLLSLNFLLYNTFSNDHILIMGKFLLSHANTTCLTD